jgi:hypothetical protein
MQLHMRKIEAKNGKNLFWKSFEKQNAPSGAYADRS